MNSKLFVGMLSCCIAVVFGPAYSAEMTFEGLHDQFPSDPTVKEARFRLDGEISDGDVERLTAALASAGLSREHDPTGRWIIALNSPGGKYTTGLDLALQFRRLGIATLVKEGKECYSACAIAFLGGSEPPHDPSTTGPDEDISTQPTDRELELGAKLGYHAPYLSIPSSSYTAEAVGDAYRAAVLDIARLIAISEYLKVQPSELPRMLAPTKDELFLVDTVDAVRSLGINLLDTSLQYRDLKSITPSMVRNLCINRWYNLRGRSAFDGYHVAELTLNEFIDGSNLLENGEDKTAFGVKFVEQNMAEPWIAYLPIAKTTDNRNFIWCIFAHYSDQMNVFYKAAGSVKELLEPLTEKNDLWDFLHSASTIKMGDEDSSIENMPRVMDMVPAETLLNDVAAVITRYQQSEPDLGRKP